MLAENPPHRAKSDRRVRLLEIEPDLGRFLSDDARRAVRELMLPVIQVAKGEDEIDARRIDRNAFGVLVLEGMLRQRLRLAGHDVMRLIGPGDLVAIEEARMPTLVSPAGRGAIADTRLAILGSDFLNAARRWPGLIAGVHVRWSEQTERVAAQLAICQLPRVADRLLAMMWLLAESWGRVTPAGVTVPLSLTHESLGALIGARRPTVSLAISELVERRAVIRQSGGWLLLEPVPESKELGAHAVAPILLEEEDSRWLGPPPPAPNPGSELLETVH